MSEIRYYQSCVSNVPTDSMSSGNSVMLTFIMDTGSILTSKVSLDVSDKTVGAFQISNKATFKFTPATKLVSGGGQIGLYSPVWYGALQNDEYPYQLKTFECASAGLQNMQSRVSKQRFRQNGQWIFFVQYLITYDSLTGGAAAEGSELIIECTYWRNPITPILTTGFQIYTYDKDGFAIDVSQDFSLDASGFQAYPVLDTAVTYVIQEGTVQKLSDYSVSIESPVPFEVDGCFVKYIFPKELQVAATDLIRVEGEEMMLAPDNTNDITSQKVAEDLGAATAEKFVVMKGCHAAQFQNKQMSAITQKLTVRFKQIKNPYSVRDTSPFKVEVYKKFTNGVLAQKILTTKAIILASQYKINNMDSFNLTATLKTVQEPTTHSFAFALKSIIPGSKPNGISSDITPAIHIYFPTTLTQDPKNKASNPANIVGKTSQVSLNGSPTYKVDSTLTYNEECQIFLCALIEFDTLSNIPVSTIEVQLSNLLNPESVTPTGQIVVTTLMKYSSDSVYYKIDQFKGQSNYQATKGTMDASKMKVYSLTPGQMTSETNQMYLLQFTSTHMVSQNGYIQIIIPNTFGLNSPSSTQA